VRAVLCSLPIPEAEERLVRERSRYFDDGEAAELAGAPLRTWAGRMALKEALARLWQYRELPGTPRDFRIGRGPNGAPRLLDEVPGGPGVLAGVRVAISHSRDTACGLAVGPEGAR